MINLADNRHAQGVVRALLGPTNTGKTHYALERMLAYSTGMIGFPLRLLARENYDRVVKIKGRSAVALMTGEEKIVPPNARYFMCTVEAMPMDCQVEFIGIDEIQLCADPDRGHIFTDRLLHARGTQETMFMGSDTIRGLVRRLVPESVMDTRERFSDLSYTGHTKLTRLPPRSAVVAFSIAGVYDIAEMIRRQRGGTAVVLGALSPRTRNAQVGMYQAGEVDYMVATDAIGMGLNMDVCHVAFAGLGKFDGQRKRRLDASEMAQIAGRAGRFRTNGTFGVTADVGSLDEDMVHAIENHRFDSLTRLYWRNSTLDYSSIKALQLSLEAMPPDRALVKGRLADDVLTFKALSCMAEIRNLAQSPARVRLLWDVCRVPDFRKTLSESHTALVARLYQELCQGNEKLSIDWVAQRIKRLDNIAGDADTLMSRIAHIRTWTYISHQSGWLDDPVEWQEHTRRIEDRLSDALHEALTKRFVDRRAAVLIQRLATDAEMLAGIRKDGAVIVEGHQVGHLEGFRFVPDIAEHGEHSRALLAAARKTLREEIAMRTQALENAAHEEISLSDEGRLIWQGHALADLRKGQSPLLPEVKVIHSEVVTGLGEQRVRDRLLAWIRQEISERLGPLVNLTTCGLKGPAAGIAFQLQENFGSMPRRFVADMADSLDQDDRRDLRRAGIDLGPDVIYMPKMMKLAAVRLRAILWSLYHDLPLPPALPNDGRASVRVDKRVNRKYYNAIGYPVLGPLAVRADMVTRLVRAAYDMAEDYKFPCGPELANPIGCSLDDLAGVFRALGFYPAAEQKAEEKNEKPAVAKDTTEKALDNGQEKQGINGEEQTDAEKKAQTGPQPEKENCPQKVEPLSPDQTDPEQTNSAKEEEESQTDERNKKTTQKIVVFQLRRPRGSKSRQHGNKKRGKKGNASRKFTARPKEPSADSPFAVLAQLKKQQGENQEG